MTKAPRTFDDKPATREQVPLLIGLMGPSGGGKTYSALRVAKGIQQISGGDIFGIDTEARRMLHYADMFKFRHVSFGAPFGSLDYLAAIEQAVKKGAGVVIVDSMSHEHEGEGGLLDTHERELDRMAGDDFKKRENNNLRAWVKPKADRQKLINRLLQLEANFILCFRAKETVKPVKIKGKTEMVQQGFMPIAGRDFIYEMTVNCLLMPGARGVPTWRSEYPGEQMMTKLPEQFRDLFANKRPLDEKIGQALAEWARGGAAPARQEAAPATNGAAPKSNRELLFDRARERMRESRATYDAWTKQLKQPHLEALADIWEELQAIDANRAAQAQDDELALDESLPELEPAE